MIKDKEAEIICLKAEILELKQKIKDDFVVYTKRLSEKDNEMSDKVFFEIRKNDKGDYVGNFRYVFDDEMYKILGEIEKTKLRLIIDTIKPKEDYNE